MTKYRYADIFIFTINTLPHIDVKILPIRSLIRKHQEVLCEIF